MRLNLGFEPDAKKREFMEIEKTIDRELGEKDAIGSILSDSAREYRLDLLADLVEQQLDVDALLALTRGGPPPGLPFLAAGAP